MHNLVTNDKIELVIATLEWVLKMHLTGVKPAIHRLKV